MGGRPSAGEGGTGAPPTRPVEPGVTSESQDPTGDHEVLEVRMRHQRPDAWSSRLYACQNLAVAPTTARLAHHVLSQLDGSVVRHRYDLPAGPAGVHVS